MLPTNKYQKLNFLPFILFVICLPIFSQSDTLYWTYFSTKDGLCDNRVQDIMEDNKGRIWFSTKNNVSVFNGSSWKTYSKKDGLLGSYISSVVQDSSGNMWFSSNHGISTFDGKKWKTYDTSDGMLSTDCRDLVVDKENRIWCTNFYKGVSMFDGKKWTTYTMEKDGLAGTWTQGVYVDSKNNIWTSHYRAGISKYNGTSWEAFKLINTHTLPLFMDKYDTLWVATRDCGVLQFYDGETTPYIDTSNGLPGDANQAATVYRDHFDRVWIYVSGSVGIIVVDSTEITHYDTSNGLKSNFGTAMFMDSKKNMWINGGGVTRISRTPTANSQPKINNINKPNLITIHTKAGFSPRIQIDLKQSDNITLDIYTLNGVKIKTVYTGAISKGKHFFNPSFKRYGSGRYIALVQSKRQGNRAVIFTLNH